MIVISYSHNHHNAKEHSINWLVLKNELLRLGFVFNENLNEDINVSALKIYEYQPLKHKSLQEQNTNSVKSQIKSYKPNIKLKDLFKRWSSPYTNLLRLS